MNIPDNSINTDKNNYIRQLRSLNNFTLLQIGKINIALYSIQYRNIQFITKTLIHTFHTSTYKLFYILLGKCFTVRFV